jgi:hypothetical protein
MRSGSIGSMEQSPRIGRRGSLPNPRLDLVVGAVGLAPLGSRLQRPRLRDPIRLKVEAVVEPLWRGKRRRGPALASLLADT